MEREYLDSKELETGMQYAGRNPAVWYQDSAGGCGDDKKAELETLLFVSYIRHVFSTILFIPSLQI